MQLMRFVDKANPENIIDAATRRQKVRASGQISLFDLFGDVEGSGFEEQVPEPDGVEWDRSVKLAREHEVLGLYVSDHRCVPTSTRSPRTATSRWPISRSPRSTPTRAAASTSASRCPRAR